MITQLFIFSLSWYVGSISGICLLIYGYWKPVWDSVTWVFQSLWVDTEDQKIPRVYKEKVGRNVFGQRVKILNKIVFSLMIRFLPVLWFPGHKIRVVMVLCHEGGGIEMVLRKEGLENLWECLSNGLGLKFCLIPLNPRSHNVLILYSFKVTPVSQRPQPGLKTLWNLKWWWLKQKVDVTEIIPWEINFMNKCS